LLEKEPKQQSHAPFLLQYFNYSNTLIITTTAPPSS